MVGEVGMNWCCENCGWSEIVGSPSKDCLHLMCNYNGHRTWRDECCVAWKPKEKETNMVEVVRCKDCIFGEQINDRYICTNAGHCQSKSNEPDWFCADGERKDS